jgi:hypothetical protein
MKGRKPKGAHLRLIDGTHRNDRHGDATTARGVATATAASFGPLTRPPSLTKFGREAWERYIRPAKWLDASREPAAIAFCELWQEMRRAPASFQAAKHSQMRSYMSTLGLTDERNRVVEQAPENDEHFDG